MGSETEQARRILTGSKKGTYLRGRSLGFWSLILGLVTDFNRSSPGNRDCNIGLPTPMGELFLLSLQNFAC